MIPDDKLDEWARLDRARTQGVWRAGTCETDRVFVPYADALGGDERVLLRMNANSPAFPFEVDARFIAMASEAIPQLLAAARVLNALLKPPHAPLYIQVPLADPEADTLRPPAPPTERPAWLPGDGWIEDDDGDPG